MVVVAVSDGCEGAEAGLTVIGRPCRISMERWARVLGDVERDAGSIWWRLGGSRRHVAVDDDGLGMTSGPIVTPSAPVTVVA